MAGKGTAHKKTSRQEESMMYWGLQPGRGGERWKQGGYRGRRAVSILGNSDVVLSVGIFKEGKQHVRFAFLKFHSGYRVKHVLRAVKLEAGRPTHRM